MAKNDFDNLPISQILHIIKNKYYNSEVQKVFLSRLSFWNARNATIFYKEIYYLLGVVIRAKKLFVE